MSERFGVLLMAYGTPRNLDEVEPYYMDIRGGRKPSPEFVNALKARYAAVGGKTPLLEITQKQARAVEDLLNTNGEKYKTYIGMKHWHPFIRAAVQQMMDDEIRYAIGLVLAPHYSRMSIQQYEDRVEQARAELNTPIQFNYVESWGNHPLFIQSIVERMAAARLKFTNPDWEKIEVIFSAHSLPEKILEWDDPYPHQLRETSELVSRNLALKQWRFAYQSAGRSQEKWLGPDITEELGRVKADGFNQVLMAPIGFVTDHLEILYDIDVEATGTARDLGLELRRIDSPNVTLHFIQALASIVQANAPSRGLQSQPSST